MSLWLTSLDLPKLPLQSCIVWLLTCRYALTSGVCTASALCTHWAHQHCPGLESQYKQLSVRLWVDTIMYSGSPLHVGIAKRGQKPRALERWLVNPVQCHIEWRKELNGTLFRDSSGTYHFVLYLRLPRLRCISQSPIHTNFSFLTMIHPIWPFRPSPHTYNIRYSVHPTMHAKCMRRWSSTN